MDKTCKTCVSLQIETDANGGRASDRSSAKISCLNGYFGTTPTPARPGQVAQPGAFAAFAGMSGTQEQRNNADEIRLNEKKAIAFNIAILKYDGIPQECNRWREGVNAYYNCINCRNSIISKVNGVFSVVGCQVKQPIDSLPIVKVIYTNPQAAVELTPIGCEYFSPEDAPAKPYHLAEVVKPSLQTLEQKIAAKYNSRSNKLSKSQYVSLVNFYVQTNCDIYLSLAQQSNSGVELTAAQMAVIEKAIDNYSRINQRKNALWKARLDHILKIKEEGHEYDLSSYRELLLKYGYLSILQEKRLQEAEVKEYGKDYSRTISEITVAADPNIKPPEFDLTLLDRKSKTKFRRRSAWSH
jgi:hypothetical protein